MAKSFGFQFGGINLGTPAPDAVERPDETTQFRILLLSDFTGRASRGITAPLADRKPVLVDRDNFEDVMRKLGVEVALKLSAEDPPVSIGFRELDDFHPDRLLDRVSVFQSLRDLRRRLKNRSTFSEAADEVRSWAKPPAAPAQPASGKEATSDVSPAGLLDEMLERTPVAPAAPGPDVASWSTYLAQLVEPYVVPGSSADEPALVSIVDEAISERMRTILHHPAFQALEAAWRGVFLLVRRLDTDEKLKLYMLDVSRDELAADLSAADDLRQSRTYRLLVEQSVQTPGATPWAVLAGDYAFEQTVADGAFLARIGHVARHAGAPFLAAARSSVVGCRSFGETNEPDDWVETTDPKGVEVWQAVRLLPEAQYLGLVLPRFLLRLPYGKNSSPCEEFAFEEMPGKPIHEHYLWGNSSFAAAYLLGEAFLRSGWDLQPGEVQEIDGMPLHVYRDDGEDTVKPCGEAVLRDRGLAAIMKHGLIPLATLQGQDTVRVYQFQSLADPSAPLGGRWSRRS